VDRPTFADEFLLAVAVAIGDARSRFAQDDAECHGPATLFSRTIFTPATAVLEIRTIGSCFRVAKGTIIAQRKDATQISP
jgi:hypothetical protein